MCDFNFYKSHINNDGFADIMQLPAGKCFINKTAPPKERRKSAFLLCAFALRCYTISPARYEKRKRNTFWQSISLAGILLYDCVALIF